MYLMRKISSGLSIGGNDVPGLSSMKKDHIIKADKHAKNKATPHVAVISTKTELKSGPSKESTQGELGLSLKIQLIVHLGFVNGTFVAPATNSDEYKAWKHCNDLAYRLVAQEKNRKEISRTNQNDAMAFVSDRRSDHRIKGLSIKNQETHTTLYVTLGEKKPTEVDDTKWGDMKLRAASLIRLALTLEIKYDVLEEDNPKNLWEKLTKTYHSKSLANRFGETIVVLLEAERLMKQESSDTSDGSAFVAREDLRGLKKNQGGGSVSLVETDEDVLLVQEEKGSKDE
ncbi:hypothetical protein AgCh_004011 [Apium graveolens]